MKLSRIVMTGTLLFAAFAAPAAAARDVPIKGTVTGPASPEFEIVIIDGKPVPVPVAPGCDDLVIGDVVLPPIWRFDGSGTGNVSHLGTVAFTMTHCTYPDSSFRDGELSFVAANGDELDLTYGDGSCEIIPGELGPLGYTCDATWTADGGTGRFAHAAGSGTFAIFGDVGDGVETLGLPDGWLTMDLAGRIAYTASDRSQK